MKSPLMNFFLAMTVHPHIQKNVHNEIDAVIGRGRLPSYQDRSSLPYFNAVYKECLRWLPGLPTGDPAYAFIACLSESRRGTLGLPHQTLSEDVYDGYFIPKASIVIVNFW